MSFSSAIRQLSQDRREWVDIGFVTKVEESDDFGLLITAQVTDGREVQARPVVPGVGKGAGLTYDFQVDEEVLLFFPQGDVNQALVLKGPTSRPQKPDSWERGKVRITQPSGVEVRTHESAHVRSVVTSEVQGDLARMAERIGQLMTIVNSLMTAAGSPAPFSPVEMTQIEMVFTRMHNEHYNSPALRVERETDASSGDF